MGISDSTKILLIRIILFTSYVLLGAVVFQAIESEEQVREMDAVRSTRMEILTKYNISESDAKRWSKTFLSTSVGSEDFLQWNYGNSFLFAMVVLTTIGYGNIVPKTVLGRLFFMVYALIGIPGTCLTLKSIGDKITELFTALITTFEIRLLKRPRSQNVELKVALTTIFLTVIFLLPLMALVVKVRHNEWSYIECYYFTFTTLSTIGFGDYLPQFKKDADYMLIFLAFVGLAFVSSIFCSINIVMEQYGVSARVVRSLREKNADKSEDEKSPSDDNALLETNEKLACDSDNLMDATAGNDNAKDLRKSLQVIEENTKGGFPLTSSGRNSFAEGAKGENRKRGSSISIGIFTC